MAACVYIVALVTGTQQGWNLNWCERLIPGQRRWYFCSQERRTDAPKFYRVHFTPIENDESFNHFCEYHGEPGGKEQGDYNLPLDLRQLGHDPEEAEAPSSITLILTRHDVHVFFRYFCFGVEPRNDQALKCVRSKVMRLILQINLKTSLSVSTFYIYTCHSLQVLDKKNVALGETDKLL